MKYWKDLTSQEQSDFSEGIVELHGFKWICYYRFVTEDQVEIYSSYGDWAQSFTHYKSMVVLL